jgi:hypothetical protein
MGKLKDNLYNTKPTSRQIKKQQKKDNEKIELKKMVECLEKKWKTTIQYNCVNCVKTAYENTFNGTNGYVSDEELIHSSKNNLKSK